MGAGIPKPSGPRLSEKPLENMEPVGAVATDGEAVAASRGAVPRIRDEKEEAIREFLPFIRYTARRLAFRLPPGLSEEDLMSAGVVGLLDAMTRFRRGQVKLKTYAEHRVRGAMLDALRAADVVPRSVRDRIHVMESARRDLERRLGRAPGEDEIAQALGLSLEEYGRLLGECGFALSLRSGDIRGGRRPDAEPVSVEDLADPNGCDPLSVVESKDRRRILARIIDGLPEKEKLVLSLYYWDEMTMREIGKIMGLTEGRVCQFHGQAIMKVRSDLAGEYSLKKPDEVPI